jgi:LasA protease
MLVFYIHQRLKLVLVGAALVFAGLACARSDVVIPVESAAEDSSETQAPATATPSPTPIQSKTPTPTLATSTPSRPEPISSPTLPPTPTLSVRGRGENILYEAQPGDTLRNLAIRFGVVPEDIRSTTDPLPEENDLLDPGLVLIIPSQLEIISPEDRWIPDSEVVYSPHAAEFDIATFIQNQDGYLNSYQEFLGGRMMSGADVIIRSALVHSINPRLLLALLEYYSGWVTDPTQPVGDQAYYPLGVKDLTYRGLYRQLTWLSNELGRGYYGWRDGSLLELTLADGSQFRLSPTLNAGTVALQYVFAGRGTVETWLNDLSSDGFIRTYQDLFGDPWEYFHPLYEPGLAQPELILPFLPGSVWAFTGGPHGAWEREAAWAALDFAPSAIEPGCAPSEEWLVAAAPGLVLRSENGLVVVDLDGDGLEQTGWVLLYLHVATKDRVAVGTFLEQGDLIGHPSCEGGIATGTHVHLVRKYNGEWILADGPLPFELSGWIAHAGSLPYQGALTKGDQTILACPCATKETLISR